MENLLRALAVEDNESDATLILYYLQKANFNLVFERVETAAEMRSALQNKTWDFVICDYSLPHFDAPAALKILHETGLDIPFIIVSGAIGEEMAVTMMKAGANDCVMKNNLRRLAPVVSRELAEVEIRRKQKRSEQIQKVIYSISNAVVTTNDLHALIEIIRDQLGTLIDTTNFYIAVYNEKTDTINLPYIADQRDNLVSFPAGKTLTSYVIKTKKPLLAKRQDLDKMEADHLIETVGEKALVWLGIPLILDNKVIGVVAVQSYENENAYKESDLEMLEFVSDQIILSIERKRTEQELRASLAKAEESDRLKTSFLANMSHEIRTPMNGIMGFSELLEDDTLNQEERREYLDIITESCRNLLTILEGIINIARIDNKQVVVNRSVFQLNRLLDELLASGKNDLVAAGKNDLSLQLDKPFEDKNSDISADKEKITTVLKNLLNNAIKFTTSGSIHFGYHYDKGMLQFHVRDTGQGIAPAMQNVIFEKFRQVDETFSRKFGGTGLGLSVSKGLVDLMGGKIWVVSEVEKGSTFFFTIPFLQEITL